MPIDPCLPVPLGGVTSSPVHRVHRIIGRIRRHGSAQTSGVKHAVAPIDGCGRVPAGKAGALPGAPAALLPKAVPIAAGAAALVGGSGVIGGFGSPPGGPGGTPGCVGTSCSPGCVGTSCNPTSVPEPGSLALLGVALLLGVMLRRPRQA